MWQRFHGKLCNGLMRGACAGWNFRKGQTVSRGSGRTSGPFILSAAILTPQRTPRPSYPGVGDGVGPQSPTRLGPFFYLRSLLYLPASLSGSGCGDQPGAAEGTVSG